MSGPTLLSRARAGDLDAQFQYARACRTPSELRTAVKWYQRAAESGHAGARCNLGYLFEMGEGVPKNAGTAAMLYQQSAAASHPLGMFNLGRCLASGTGVRDVNAAAALYYMVTAAKGGDFRGSGTDADRDHVLRWHTPSVSRRSSCTFGWGCKHILAWAKGDASPVHIAHIRVAHAPNDSIPTTHVPVANPVSVLGTAGVVGGQAQPRPAPATMSAMVTSGRAMEAASIALRAFVQTNKVYALGSLVMAPGHPLLLLLQKLVRGAFASPASPGDLLHSLPPREQHNEELCRLHSSVLTTIQAAGQVGDAEVRRLMDLVDDEASPCNAARPVLALALHHMGNTIDAETEVLFYVRTWCAHGEPADASSLDPLVLLVLSRIARSQGEPLASNVFLACFCAMYAYASSLCSSSSDVFDDEALSTDGVYAPPTPRGGGGDRDPAAAHRLTPLTAADRELADEWMALQRQPGAVPCASMDTLLRMVGMRRVKRKAIDIYKRMVRVRQLPPGSVPPMSLNFIFAGSPGTGKTEVARIFAAIFKELGVRTEDPWLTTAEELRSLGADDFGKRVDAMKSGLVFIDEAYQLQPSQGGDGRTIVNKLLTLSEDRRDSLTFVLAGYQGDIDEALLRFNDGFSSRFEVVQFEDYSAEELRLIWEGMLRKARWHVESESVTRIVIARLARRSGRRGFGNAREVRKAMERGIAAAVGRVDLLAPTRVVPGTRHGGGGRGARPQHPRDGGAAAAGVAAGGGASRVRLIMRMEDVIGPRPEPSTSPHLRAALEDLGKLTGLDQVKREVQTLCNLVLQNYDRELRGEEPVDVALSRLFYGNPGTGKTTVAKIFGRVLKGLNLLSVGEVAYRHANELKGSHVGETGRRVVDLLKQCEGKVLVVDEAYTLNDGQYGKEALDTLVGNVSGAPGEDIAVFMLGYREPMEKMLREQNPGLASRMRPHEAFDFADYTNEQLRGMLFIKLRQKRMDISRPNMDLAVKYLTRMREQVAHFGNAREVESMVERAQRLCATDGTRSPSDVQLRDLVAEETADIMLGRVNPMAQLDELYGAQKIRSELERIRASVLGARARREPVSSVVESLQFRFVGNAGTGKTTVAGIFAGVLSQLGLVSNSKPVVVAAQDLTGAVVGEAKNLVRQNAERARGGVLFIDEAYRLGENAYGEEALVTLLSIMTEKEYRGRMVVVLAGYETEINAMLRRNQGLSSRFARQLHFPDWTVEECTGLAVQLLQKVALAPPEVADALRAAFEDLRRREGWGNARDVKSVVSAMITSRDVRQFGGHGAAPAAATTGAADGTFSVSDVEEAHSQVRAGRTLAADVDELSVDMGSLGLGGAGRGAAVGASTFDHHEHPVGLFADKWGQPMPHRRHHAGTHISGADPRGPHAPGQAFGPGQSVGRGEAFVPPFDRRSPPARPAYATAEASATAPAHRFEEREARPPPVASHEREEAASAEDQAMLHAVLNPETFIGRLLPIMQRQGYSAQQALRLLSAGPDAMDDGLLRAITTATGWKERLVKVGYKRQHASLNTFFQQLREQELELERIRDEEERRRRQAEEQARQQALREMGVCCMGFDWLKVLGGYRCAGGSHSMSDAEVDAHLARTTVRR